MHELFEVNGIYFWVNFNLETKKATVTGPRASEFSPLPVSPPIAVENFEGAKAEAIRMAEKFVRGQLVW